MITRDDLFRPDDEDAGYFVFHFTTWAKAHAMQHWIDRTRIGSRPMPKLGETRKEAAQARRAGLAWAFNTGAAEPIVCAFVNARVRGDEELTSFNTACDLCQVPRSTRRWRYSARSTRSLSGRANTIPIWFAPIETDGGATPPHLPLMIERRVRTTIDALLLVIPTFEVLPHNSDES